MELTIIVRGEKYMIIENTTQILPIISMRFLWSRTSSNTRTAIAINATTTTVKAFATLICSKADHMILNAMHANIDCIVENQANDL